MKSKIYNTSIILFSFLVLQSCFREKEDPCGQQQYNYSLLSEIAKSKVPYLKPEFDTISFASDKGDTVVFVRQPKDSSWYCKTHYGNINCLPDYDCSEVYGANYNCIKGQGNFEFKHASKIALQIGFSKPSRDFTNIIDIRFNNLRFLYNDYSVGSKNFLYFLESISFKNKTYNNVIYDFEATSLDTLSAKGYYVANDGLFYVQDKSINTNWILIKP